MADGIKTSGEAAAAGLTGPELFRGVQSGANVKVTGDQIKTFTHQGNLPFPAAQVTSADPNTLDDYEEGTWTPVLRFGGASVGITYLAQGAGYTKIGNVVVAWANPALSNKGSSVGIATIAGLPFAANGDYTSQFTLSADVLNLDVAGGFYHPYCWAFNNTVLNLREEGDNVGSANFTDADFSNNTSLLISGTYRV